LQQNGYARGLLNDKYACGSLRWKFLDAA